MPLFDSDFLKKIEYLSLVSRRSFRGQLLAQRRTKELGGGIEFADHRDYTPGDDFRYLDWNLFARHDELLLKRFQEEEDLHVYILVDCSRSMQYGNPSKFDLARRVAAALAYIALADLDRVAIIGFASRMTGEIPLSRGKFRILGLMQFLEQLEASGDATALADVATAFIHRSQRRGLVVVISDLFDPAGFERGLDILRHHRYEPHIVHVIDREEAEPKLLGDVQMIDVESSAERKVTVTERHLRRYREIFANFVESVQTYCHGHGLGYTTTTSDTPFDDLILQMMKKSGTLS